MSITAVDVVNISESHHTSDIDEAMRYINQVIQKAAKAGNRRATILCGGNLIRSYTKPTETEALCIKRLRRLGFEVDYGYFGTHHCFDDLGRDRRAYSYGIIIDW